MYQILRIPVEWSSTAWKWCTWCRNDENGIARNGAKGFYACSFARTAHSFVRFACLSVFARLAARICLLLRANFLALPRKFARSVARILSLCRADFLAPLYGFADSLFTHSFAPMLMGKKHTSTNEIQCYNVPILLHNVWRNERKLSLKPRNRILLRTRIKTQGSHDYAKVNEYENKAGYTA